MRRPIRWRDEDLTVGITVGLTHADAAQGPTADELFAAADQQMYLRKRCRKASAEQRAARTGGPIDDASERHLTPH